MAALGEFQYGEEDSDTLFASKLHLRDHVSFMDTVENLLTKPEAVVRSVGNKLEELSDDFKGLKGELVGLVCEYRGRGIYESDSAASKRGEPLRDEISKMIVHLEALLANQTPPLPKYCKIQPLK